MTGSNHSLAETSKDFQASSPHKGLESSSHLSCSQHSQRTNNGLHSTQHSLSKAGAHGRSRSSLMGSVAQNAQTSKSSRYLQRHLLPQPSALQQLQAFSDRQKRGTHAGAQNSSHADDETTFPDTLRSNLPQLCARPASAAVQHQDESASTDQEDRAVQVQATASQHWTSYAVAAFAACIVVPNICQQHGLLFRQQAMTNSLAVSKQ